MNADDVLQFLQRYFQLVAVDLEEALDKYVADESLKEHARFFQTAFPGYRVEPIEVLAEGNKAMVYANFYGTHTGPMMDLEPTGKEVALPFMIIYYFDDGKIVNHHFLNNEMELMRQLGVMPAASTA
jgi:predicted ester cyclase